MVAPNNRGSFFVNAGTGNMIKIGSVVLLAAILSGCGGLGGVRDAIPFGNREKPVPGERRDINIGGEESNAVAATQSVASVGPPQGNANWSQPGGYASNSVGHLSYSGNVATAWRTGVGTVGRRGRPPTAPPIVHQGRVFAVDARANVTSVDASSGGQIWRISLKPEKEGRHGATGGGVAAEGGVIFVTTGFGTIAALNLADGGVIWRADVGMPLRSAPTVSNGKVFFVSAENEVFAYNTVDGSELWSFRGIPESAGFLSGAAPAVSGGKVVVPFTSGEVIAFDTESGETAWIDALTRTSRMTSVLGINDVAARPVIDNGIVYAVSVSGRMIAVSLSSGARVWTRNIGSAYTPVVSGSSVFVVGFDNKVYALDRSNGQTQWSVELPKQKKKQEAWAGPVLAGSKLWIGSSRGRLLSVNPSNGTFIGDTKVAGPVSIPPVIASGRMYLLDNQGTLSAFN